MDIFPGDIPAANVSVKNTYDYTFIVSIRYGVKYRGVWHSSPGHSIEFPPGHTVTIEGLATQAIPDDLANGELIDTRITAYASTYSLDLGTVWEQSGTYKFIQPVKKAFIQGVMLIDEDEIGYVLDKNGHSELQWGGGHVTVSVAVRGEGTIPINCRVMVNIIDPSGTGMGKSGVIELVPNEIGTVRVIYPSPEPGEYQFTATLINQDKYHI